MATTDLLSLISSVPSLMSLFGGGTTAPYQKEQEQLAARQNQISQALTDNNNPLYQQLYGQYKQQGQDQLASTIAEAQAQNRMNSNLGRTPLFNQERGSENIFRTLTQGMQNSGAQADQQTRQALSQAGGQTLGGLQGYNAITPYTANANKAQNLGFQGIYDLLRGVKQNQNNDQKNLAAINGPADYASQMRMPQQVSTGSMGAGNYSQPKYDLYNLYRSGTAMSQGMWPAGTNMGWQ